MFLNVSNYTVTNMNAHACMYKCGCPSCFRTYTRVPCRYPPCRWAQASGNPCVYSASSDLKMFPIIMAPDDSRPWIDFAKLCVQLHSHIQLSGLIEKSNGRNNRNTQKKIQKKKGSSEWNNETTSVLSWCLACRPCNRIRAPGVKDLGQKRDLRKQPATESYLTVWKHQETPLPIAMWDVSEVPLHRERSKWKFLDGKSSFALEHSPCINKVERLPWTGTAPQVVICHSTTWPAKSLGPNFAHQSPWGLYLFGAIEASRAPQGRKAQRRNKHAAVGGCMTPKRHCLCAVTISLFSVAIKSGIRGLESTWLDSSMSLLKSLRGNANQQWCGKDPTQHRHHLGLWNWSWLLRSGSSNMQVLQWSQDETYGNGASKKWRDMIRFRSMSGYADVSSLEMVVPIISLSLSVRLDQQC